MNVLLTSGYVFGTVYSNYGNRSHGINFFNALNKGWRGMKIRIKLELDLPEGGPVRRRGISSDVLTRWAGITYLFYKIWEVGIDYMSGEAVDYIVNVLAALIK